MIAIILAGLAGLLILAIDCAALERRAAAIELKPYHLRRMKERNRCH